MKGYLTRLVQRNLGLVSFVLPQIPSRFEPSQIINMGLNKDEITTSDNNLKDKNKPNKYIATEVSESDDITVQGSMNSTSDTNTSKLPRPMTNTHHGQRPDSIVNTEPTTNPLTNQRQDKITNAVTEIKNTNSTLTKNESENSVPSTEKANSIRQKNKLNNNNEASVPNELLDEPYQPTQIYSHNTEFDSLSLKQKHGFAPSNNRHPLLKESSLELGDKDDESKRLNPKSYYGPVNIQTVLPKEKLSIINKTYKLDQYTQRSLQNYPNLQQSNLKGTSTSTIDIPYKSSRIKEEKNLATSANRPSQMPHTKSNETKGKVIINKKDLPIDTHEARRSNIDANIFTSNNDTEINKRLQSDNASGSNDNVKAEQLDKNDNDSFSFDQTTSNNKNIPKTSTTTTLESQNATMPHIIPALDSVGFTHNRTDKQSVHSRQQDTTVKVTIGHIEVRAEPAQIMPPAPQKRTRSGPSLSLDEYLNRHNRGGQN